MAQSASSSSSSSPSASAHVFFAQTANKHLSTLHQQHDIHLANGSDSAVQATQHAAATIRTAVLLHRTASQIVALPSPADQPLSASRAYLRGLLPRLDAAISTPDLHALATLSAAAQSVLDGMLHPGNGVFEPVAADSPPPFRTRSRAPGASAAALASEQSTAADTFPFPDPDDPPPPPEQPGLPPRLRQGRSVFSRFARERSASTSSDSSPRSRSFCALSCADLSTKDRVVLWLYFVMVIGALIAVAAVTAEFIQQAVAPGSFIRSTQSDQLPAPVVTVCLSQTGVPFSRLQLFDFVDAEGRSYLGTDPNVAYSEQKGVGQFKGVVERFWDNPDGEDCDSKVGDFFPFPLRSLNDIANGKNSTRCRPCYRVGSRHLAVARDTSFQNSSVMHMFTDNYFLQCMKNERGLDDESMEFLHRVIERNATDLEEWGILTTATEGGSISQLSEEQIETISWQQACNIFYFAFFPAVVGRRDASVDVRYQFDGEKWVAIGRGPYFEPKVERTFLPQESLQMFVSTNSTTEKGELGRHRDMILIGPSTQTFATFRAVVVYGMDRYDISSSTSSLRSDDVLEMVGYWLRYKIFYNYNRFVVDEYYRESTYPASQWIVDLTGYATLFTGASLFSLLLLPLLRTMRRREKQRLLRRKPEVYLWSKARQQFASSAMAPRGDDDNLANRNVLLPGFNV